MATPERRRDNWKAVLAIVACFTSGAGGGLVGIKTGVAVLAAGQTAQEKRLDNLEGQMRMKLDRADNIIADAAQDARIADILSRLNTIDTNVLTLLTLQSGAGSRERQFIAREKAYTQRGGE